VRRARRRLTPAIGLVTLLTLVGCAGDDGDEAAITTTTMRTSTSTFAPSTTTSLESDAIPDPATTGEDFDRIFREILAFESWLFEHPEVEPLA
jgi:hypothetical protein